MRQTATVPSINSYSFKYARTAQSAAHERPMLVEKKKKYDYNLVSVRFSAPPHFSLYSNYEARVHLHPPFLGGQNSRSPALSLTLLRRVATFLGYGFRLSNFLLTPGASKHCRNRSPITLPPHPPAARPGWRRFSEPLGCTQHKPESRNGIFTALRP